MVKEIKVCSRQNAKLFQCEKPWSAISVATEAGEFPDLSKENRVDLLRLHFWDIANPSPNMIESGDSKLFSRAQAEKLIEFVDRVWEKSEVLLVHCEAGLSRSPAIAAAITCMKLNKEGVEKYFSKYMPNGFVFKTLLEVKFGPDSEVFNGVKHLLEEKSYEFLDECWSCLEN